MDGPRWKLWGLEVAIPQRIGAMTGRGDGRAPGVRGRGGRGRGVEQAPALGQTDLLRAVGEKADVADAREARRHDVEQEAVDEGLGWQGEVADDAAVLAVLIGERHLAIRDRRDAMVRDRHAVGVAREVVEDGRGSPTRRLRIHDPGPPSDDGEPRAERRRRLDGRERRREDQTLLTIGDLEPREEPPTEGPRQGADGKEKGRAPWPR